MTQVTRCVTYYLGLVLDDKFSFIVVQCRCDVRVIAKELLSFLVIS